MLECWPSSLLLAHLILPRLHLISACISHLFLKNYCQWHATDTKSNSSADFRMLSTALSVFELCDDFPAQNTRAIYIKARVYQNSCADDLPRNSSLESKTRL